MNVLQAVKTVVLSHRHATEPAPQRRAFLIDLDIAGAALKRARLDARKAFDEWCQCEPEIKNEMRQRYLAARERLAEADAQCHSLRQMLNTDNRVEA